MRVAPCTQLAREASTASARKLRHERGSELTKLRHVSLSCRVPWRLSTLDVLVSSMDSLLFWRSAVWSVILSSATECIVSLDSSAGTSSVELWLGNPRGVR